MKFKDYFNIYDVLGNLHTGFLQSMDFTALAGDITMLNELTMAFIDAHLYNELSNSLVMRQWFSYINYSKDNGRVEIFSQFYTDFVNALAAKLYKAEEWYKLKNTDFKSISATEIEIITHGKKQTDKEYGEAETTRAYGQDETSTEYGATTSATEYGATSGSIRYGEISSATEYGATSKETEYGATSKETEYGATSGTTQYGATQKTIGYGATEKETEYGAKKNTKEYDRVVVSVTKDQDTHVIGELSGTNTSTTTNKLYPLGAGAFIDDTQSVANGSNSTSRQTNTDTWGDQSSSTAARTDIDKDDAHTDTVTEATHTDTEATTQHTDTTTEALHTDTTTEALHTDTTTEALHTDTTTKAQHTDTTTEALHTDTTTEALHIDTTTRSARTDTETKAAKQDTETVQSYIDRKERTKHIIISPDKYFEIEKELANIGVYDLMLEAVKDTMLLCVWDNEEGWTW